VPRAPDNRGTRAVSVEDKYNTNETWRDPATSALDANCRAHEVDDLYVVDAGFFPSSAAMNSALTIVANALRLGAHLAERLK
jgi:choline dehydrogenase-like flavoprotein